MIPKYFGLANCIPNFTCTDRLDKIVWIWGYWRLGNKQKYISITHWSY